MMYLHVPKNNTLVGLEHLIIKNKYSVFRSVMWKNLILIFRFAEVIWQWHGMELKEYNDKTEKIMYCRKIHFRTVRPRSIIHCYIVTCYMIIDMTSWTCNTLQISLIQIFCTHNGSLITWLNANLYARVNGKFNARQKKVRHYQSLSDVLGNQ